MFNFIERLSKKIKSRILEMIIGRSLLVLRGWVLKFCWGWIFDRMDFRDNGRWESGDVDYR